jgi:hypothetical protein
MGGQKICWQHEWLWIFWVLELLEEKCVQNENYNIYENER